MTQPILSGIFSALNICWPTQIFLRGKPDTEYCYTFPSMINIRAGKGRLHFDGMKPDFNGTRLKHHTMIQERRFYAFDYISDAIARPQTA